MSDTWGKHNVIINENITIGFEWDYLVYYLFEQCSVPNKNKINTIYFKIFLRFLSNEKITASIKK